MKNVLPWLMVLMCVTAMTFMQLQRGWDAQEHRVQVDSFQKQIASLTAQVQALKPDLAIEEPVIAYEEWEPGEERDGVWVPYPADHIYHPGDEVHFRCVRHVSLKGRPAVYMVIKSRLESDNGSKYPFDDLSSDLTEDGESVMIFVRQIPPQMKTSGNYRVKGRSVTDTALRPSSSPFVSKYLWVEVGTNAQ